MAYESPGELVPPPDEFLDRLKEYFLNQRKLFNFIPRVNGIPLDLYALYREVVSRGGYKQVTRTNQWVQVASSLGYLLAGPNVTYALRDFYVRYLDEFERNCLPALQATASQDEMDYYIFQKPACKFFRKEEPLPRPIQGDVDIKLVENSLLSNLPNEIDAGLNALVVLSSIPKALKLCYYNRITSSLITLTGVCQQDECCAAHPCGSHLRMSNFWAANLTTKGWIYFQEPLEECCKLVALQFDSDSINNLFNLTEEYHQEFYTVQAVLTVFRNSLLEDADGLDCAYLSRIPCFLRLLLTCAYCQASDLRRLALDCLVLLHFPLTDEPYLSIILDCVQDLLLRDDRMDLLTALKLLIAICEEPVSLGTDRIRRSFFCLHSLSGYRNEAFLDIILRQDQNLARILAVLFLPDLHLVITACDLLYCLSCMNRRLCSRLLHCDLIQHLESFLRVEAQSFGERSMYRLKVMQPPEAEHPSSPLSCQFDVNLADPKREVVRRALDMALDPEQPHKCESVALSPVPSQELTNGDGIFKDDLEEETLTNGHHDSNGFLSPSTVSGTILSEDSNQSSSTQSSNPPVQIINGGANYGTQAVKTPSRSRSNPTPVVTFKYEKDLEAPLLSDQFPSYWLAKYIEEAPGYTVSRTQIYAEYQAAHKVQYSNRKYLSWNNFILVMRASFPFTLDQTRLKNHLGNNEIHFKRLRFKRDAPKQVSSGESQQTFTNGTFNSVSSVPQSTNLVHMTNQKPANSFVLCDTNSNPILSQTNQFLSPGGQPMMIVNGASPTKPVLTNGISSELENGKRKSFEPLPPPTNFMGKRMVIVSNAGQESLALTAAPLVRSPATFSLTTSPILLTRPSPTPTVLLTPQGPAMISSYLR
ncbi:AT-rich interactive domain-containing protein 2 [Cichlidogyrus casuarinus]|uniref:AT-rich interactive domain-containing protein 2 n=1 Tax=Cichlidogyrus casuarinus TaxID=1844966 RepID=A0ABD2QK91_9PLAT